MFVFAQLSTSVSDDQIRLIIIALLVVAVLLAALTLWYFVKTSPTRRVRAAQARRQTVAGDRAATSEPDGSRTAREPDRVVTAEPVSTAQVAVDDGDEWDRLTAPERRRPAGG